ncbi:MAG: hypothetical protein IMF15_10275 [Proteobacteria bacterium]|nr:hypothetical protein [Pseudomonadota bacterium]
MNSNTTVRISSRYSVEMNLRTVSSCLALSLVLSVNSFPLHAEAGGPDYWQVRGVERNDVLNMRSTPDFKAAKTGEIPFDAQCVRNMGCKGGLTFDEFSTLSDIEKQQILKQRPSWCRVAYNETTGWVAGRYLREDACPENRNRQGVISPGIDPFNHTYSIEKEKVILRNGHARETIPGTTAVIITEVIHRPVFADRDDGKSKESVSVLMQHTGGTGSFYYLAAAAVEGGSVIESYFLGDRIKITSLKIIEKLIIVEYLERSINQPMASRPTVKVSKKFRLDEEKIVISLQ